MTRSYADVTGVPTTEIGSPAALQAYVHPLRLRLMGLLRSEGPSTASALARAVGESSGSTSYHLRQLARFGFVELAPDQPNRREKLWRATTSSTDVRVEAIADDPAAMAALDRLIVMQIERFGRHLVTATRHHRGDSDWMRAAVSSDAFIRMTPPMLAELREELFGVVARFAERGRELAADAPDTSQVSLYLGAVPVAEEDSRW